MKWVEKAEKIAFILLIILLPTQWGRHFWPSWSLVSGVRVDYLSPTLFLTDVLVLGFLALTAAQIFFGKSKLGRLGRLGVLGGLGLLGLAVLNTMMSLSPAVSAYKWLKVAEMGFVVIAVSRQRLAASQIGKWLLIPVAYEAGLAFWQFWAQSSIGGVWWWLGERTFNSLTPGIANAYINGQLVLRPYGTLPHPNVLGGFLAVTLPFLLWHFPHNSRKLNAFILGLGFTTLLISMSRVAIVVGVVAVEIVLWRKLPGWKRKLGILGMVGVLGVLGIGLRLGALGVESEPVVVREQLGRLAIAEWAHSPILGTGLGTAPLYGLQSTDYQLQLRNYSLAFQPVHSIYLLLLSETGVLGVLGGLGLLGLVAKRIREKKNWVSGLALGEILILGLFDHYFLTLQQGQLLLALVLGLALADRSRNN